MQPSVSALSPSTPAATGSRSSKRKVEATGSLASSKKLCLGFNKDGMALRKESFNTKNFDGRVQCAAFALEMLSQNPGIQHTINLLHVGLDDKKKYELQRMLLADSEAPSPKLEDPMKGRQDPRPSSTPPTHPSSVD
ncbi:hypothetical protein EYR40_010479 [Pleurotus pulmonarius]|nr:hypothetical protein EYR40_010479 [Pleurotus pulmonarius]